MYQRLSSGSPSLRTHRFAGCYAAVWYELQREQQWWWIGRVQRIAELHFGEYRNIVSGACCYKRCLWLLRDTWNDDIDLYELELQCH